MIVQKSMSRTKRFTRSDAMNGRQEVNELTSGTEQKS